MNKHLFDIRERFLQKLEESVALSFFDAGPSSLSLEKAIRYSLLNGGKRLRPLLTFASAIHQEPQRFFTLALPAALAVEYVHTFSLIHDDLPPMDDDDFRRGKLSCHRKFNEGIAILAGDALLADAFALVANASISPAKQCLELAKAVGRNGLVAGQTEDILSKKTAGPSWINQAKTARLFEASLVLGAIASGQSGDQIRFWRSLGHHFGLAFQALDDMMDAPNENAENILAREKEALLALAKPLDPSSVFHEIVQITFGQQ